MREEKAALSSRAAVLSLSLSVASSVDSGKKDAAGRRRMGEEREKKENVLLRSSKGKRRTRRTCDGGCRRLSLDGERCLGRG